MSIGQILHFLLNRLNDLHELVSNSILYGAMNHKFLTEASGEILFLIMITNILINITIITILERDPWIASIIKISSKKDKKIKT